MNYPYQMLEEEPYTFCLHQAMIEAEQRGYDSVVQMWEAEEDAKKEKDDARDKELADLREYKKLSEERFNKMELLIESLISK